MTVHLENFLSKGIEFTPNVAASNRLFRTVPSLSRVSVEKYSNFKSQNKNKQDHKIFPKRLESFLPEDELRRQKSSLFSLLKHSAGLFPGFKFIAGEFVKEEWLSLVDLHKAFHRDHIYHQTQVAVITDDLLTKIFLEGDFMFSDDLLKLIGKLKDKKISATACIDKKKGLRLSLLDMVAYLLFRNAFGTNYFSDFIKESGINISLLDIHEPRICKEAFQSWRYIAKTSALTAAYYHDIGYPFQFVKRVERELDPLTNNKSMNKSITDILFKLFRERLFMKALAGYQSFGKITHSDRIDNIRETLSKAMIGSHGLPGAVSFLSIHDSLDGYEIPGGNRVNTIIKEIAATAILMHDMQKIYGNPVKQPQLRLSFKRDPVSFLVTLADQIQEYGRSSLSNSPRDNKGDSELNLSIEQLTKATKIYIENDILNITYVYSQNIKAGEKSQVSCNTSRLHEWQAYKSKKNIFIPALLSEYWNKNDGFLDFSGLFDGVQLTAKI
jgi:hypothetical protein